MSDVKSDVMCVPYSTLGMVITEETAKRCQRQLEDEGRSRGPERQPYVIIEAKKSAWKGDARFILRALPLCFVGYSRIDDLVGNKEKAETCQKELKRMTGQDYVINSLGGGFIFSEDFEVVPTSGLATQDLLLFGTRLMFPSFLTAPADKDYKPKVVGLQMM